MKKIVATLDIRSVILGVILGFFIAMLAFSALVPSGIDMIRVYHLRQYTNMMQNTRTPQQ